VSVVLCATSFNNVLQSSAADRSQAVDLLIPSNQTMSSNAGSRDLHAVTKARYQKEMREELLSKGEVVPLYLTECPVAYLT